MASAAPPGKTPPISKPTEDFSEARRAGSGPTVLDLVRRRDGLSRAALAQLTGLSPQAISKIVARLVDKRLLRESGRESVGVGKARTRLSVIDSARFAIGVHLDRTERRVCLVNLAGQVVASRVAPYQEAPTPASTYQAILASSNQLLQEANIDRNKVIGCGVGMVGPLNHHTGIATAPNNFYGWADVPIKQDLTKILNLPVALDKESNLVMLAEHWWVARSGWTVVIFIGTGIGAALMLDGEIYRGVNSMAGEFGHMVLDRNGPPCVCGRRGCVEALASPAAVVADAAGSDSNQTASAWDATTPQAINVLASQARSGNPTAQQALQRAGFWLGVAAANAVSLLDISDVILTGPMLQALGVHYQRGFEDGYAATEIDPGAGAELTAIKDWSVDSVAVGAAMMLLSRVG